MKKIKSITLKVLNEEMLAIDDITWCFTSLQELIDYIECHNINNYLINYVYED